jgi:hypothetical protein
VSVTHDSDERTEPLLELVAEQDPNGEVAATIPVRWCLSPALIAEMRKRSFKDPHLVLIVRSVQDVNDPEIRRQYVRYADTSVYVTPLAAEMRYVSFSRPGHNEILAAVVDIDSDSDAKLVRKLRNSPETESYWYEDWADGPSNVDTTMSMMAEDGQPKLSAWAELRHIPTNFVLGVEVPSGMFADDPPEWLKTLVHKFFRGKEKDQCHLRKRVIPTLVASAFMLPLALIVKPVAALLGLFLGYRRLNLRSVVQPLEINPFKPLLGHEPSVWTQKKDKEGGYKPRAFPLMVINPVFALGLPSVIYTATLIVVGTVDAAQDAALLNLGWLEVVLYFNAGIWSLALLATIVTWLYTTAGPLAKLAPRKVGFIRFIIQMVDDRRAERVRRQRQAEEDWWKAFQAMACRQEGVTPTLDALPTNKRTISLRASRFKAAVCKPFAR